MAKALVFMMCPLGIAVALLRRYARVVPSGPAARGDGPERHCRGGRRRRHIRLGGRPVPAGRR